MRKQGIWAGTLITAGVLFWLPASAASYNGGWILTGASPALVAEVTPLDAGPGSLFLYDVDAAVRDEADTVKLLDDASIFAGPLYYAEITVSELGASQYQASAVIRDYGKVFIQELTLDLGESPLFGFFFASSGDRYYDYDLGGPASSGTYDLVSSEAGMAVNVQGASPAPAPASLALLGSGLLGLLSLRRRAKR